MNIKQLCEDAHKNAVEKGFYDCKTCGGVGRLPWGKDSVAFGTNDTCTICGGSGIDPDKNIGELLALICSELYEALEAHRCGRFALCKAYDLSLIEFPESEKNYFELCIKDSFEDEIADVFIRLFDLCGYLGIDLKIDKERMEYKPKFTNIGEYIYCISLKLPTLNIINWDRKFDWFFTMLLQFCEHCKIDIEKHIALKMAYNKTRPRKHGKDY